MTLRLVFLGGLLSWFVVTSAFSSPNQTKPSQNVFEFSTLEISVLGKTVTLDSSRIITSQSEFSLGGSTSVRNVPASLLEWKKQGYFQRSRDLGQVFYIAEKVDLRSIVLRTGPSDKAVLDGCQGAEVFIQFFEVEGDPRINDNGSPAGTKSKHGFSDSHRCDDFIEGVAYIPLSRIFIGKFPSIPSTYPPEKVLDDRLGRLVYMRWKLSDAVSLNADKSYAFLVGFRNPGPGYGFTLANTNKAAMDAVPSLNDSYPEGWGIRREGDGSLPPVMHEMDSPPVQSDMLQRLIKQSMFEAGISRFHLSPTTDGYPDVDTYRDLEFILEE